MSKIYREVWKGWEGKIILPFFPATGFQEEHRTSCMNVAAFFNLAFEIFQAHKRIENPIINTRVFNPQLKK